MLLNVNCALERFLCGLDRHCGRIPLLELEDGLAGLDVSVGDVGDFVRFSPERYQRNLMHSGPAFQALVLCWLNGQRSPIHDHRGSSCGVLVLEGVATETVFERAGNGMVYATHSRELRAGCVCASQDDDIHQMSNLQASGELITLHMYSPPLLTMGLYSLTSADVGEFHDPVAECLVMDGAGI